MLRDKLMNCSFHQ